MKSQWRAPLGVFASILVLPAAILAGSLIGVSSESRGARLGEGVDLTVYLLIALVFFEMHWPTVKLHRSDLPFLSLLWVANFVIVPTIGFLIASVFLSGKPLFMTGLVIYFMSPCTDWFLGFTRLARGNVALGAVLIPINMLSQLLLYPVYLTLFTQWTANPDLAIVRETIVRWFIIPFLLAGVLRLFVGRVLSPGLAASVLDVVKRLHTWVLALLVLQIFAGNAITITRHWTVFFLVLAAVFTFFATTLLIFEWVARQFRLAYADHVLLTMTTAARNAPLMLGVTMAAIPDQPLVYTAIVLGMLVEFPHLTLLKHLLLRRRARLAEPMSEGSFGDGRHKDHPETLGPHQVYS